MKAIEHVRGQRFSIGTSVGQPLTRGTSMTSGCGSGFDRLLETDTGESSDADGSLTVGRGNDAKGRPDQRRAPDADEHVPSGHAERTIGDMPLRSSVLEAEGGRSSAPASSTVQLVAQSILRAASVHQLAGTTTLNLRLSTDRFKRVDVGLQLVGGRLKATLAVGDGAEYRLLRDALPELEASLRARGVAADPVVIEGRLPVHAGTTDHDRRSPTPACETEARSSDAAVPTASRVAPRRSSVSPTDYVA